MKTLAGLLLLFALGAVCASAQILDNATINLTSTGTTTITNYNSGSTGTLNSVACYLSNDSVNPVATLKVSLDGGSTTTTYALFSTGGGFSNPIVPFQIADHTYNTATFQLPFNVTYKKTGLVVSVTVTTATSTGSLNCSVLHS